MKDVSSNEFYKAASTTAEHFGFVTLDAAKERLPQERQTKLEHSIGAQDRKVDDLHGLLTQGVCYYADNRLHHLSEPILFYTLEQVPRSGDAALALHVFGVEKSIAEAIVIETLRALSAELGYTDHTVHINSLGDRESITRYNRELNNFLKKRMEDMPPPARELMKEHQYLALMHLIEKEHELGFKAPSPLEYLSDQSRRHFRDVVEYLDMTNTPYEINPKLLGHHECFGDTIFSIELLDEEGRRMPLSPLTMRGGRYSTFADRHIKYPIQAVGAVALLNDKKAPQRTPRAHMPSHKTIYVAQLGFGPKIKSLMLINDLRRAGIAVKQDLASDSLSTQLRTAEAADARYTVIIGQKEYVDGTVILRDMLGRTQEYVPATELVGRLKRSLRS